MQLRPFFAHNSVLAQHSHFYDKIKLPNIVSRCCESPSFVHHHRFFWVRNFGAGKRKLQQFFRRCHSIEIPLWFIDFVCPSETLSSIPLQKRTLTHEPRGVVSVCLKRKQRRVEIQTDSETCAWIEIINFPINSRTSSLQMPNAGGMGLWLLPLELSSISDTSLLESYSWRRNLVPWRLVYFRISAPFSCYTPMHFHLSWANKRTIV